MEHADIITQFQYLIRTLCNKSYDEYLQFVLLTGVSKFSHVSVFSDLNHLVDLTLDPNYADLCGITQQELEGSFEPEITEIIENSGKSRETTLKNCAASITATGFQKNTDGI